jgi:hypothetical protein
MNNQPDHKENTQRITAYISYLRDISRKIISRNGFEKCLLNGTASQIENIELEVKPESGLYNTYNNAYYEILQKTHDKKLFIGLGTILGTRKRIYAAPLLLIQCEMEKSEVTHCISIKPDMESLSLNYDCISTLSTNYQNEEDDIINAFTEYENNTIETIENLLKEFSDFDIERLNSLSDSVFDKLKANVEHFNDFKKINTSDYNFFKEYRINKLRPPKNAANKKDKEKSIFDKELVFVNANHLFLNVIPDQLSTFEALNSFVENISEENDFKNPVVEKLLINALTENRVEIGRTPIEDDLQNIIDSYIPISLSNSQIQGLKNAWANEISYIQGPPGTGKSHTISAIVLSAIALNKKVLVLSQKTAALQVVNKKIEPYLTDDDGLLGICYYDTTARKKIRDYCNYLKSQNPSSYSFKRDKTILANKVEKFEKELLIKLSELKTERSKLEKTLDKQRKHKEVNDIFLKELDRLNTDFFKVPNGFKFKKITDESKYKAAIERLEALLAKGANYLTANLYIHKFKEHLKTKFETPQDWLENSSLAYFSRSFIRLNSIYTEVLQTSKKLTSDANNIRKNIKNLKSDILVIQKNLVKLKYKNNVFNCINDVSYQKEIDKFNGMLTNVNTRIIDKKMRDIDFKKVTDVIPFWTAEIRHLGHLFPLIPDLFDLVIVDEASQVNLAEILPAFYRGKKICIVGDHQQLSLKAAGLNFSLGKNFDELTWEKYNRTLLDYEKATRKKLTVTQASILDFIKSDDYNVIPTEVMLDEHFRSLPRLAKYTSRTFYKDQDNPEGKLKIMTETPDKLSLECFQAVKVNGKREIGTQSKVVLAEAEEIVKIIFCLTKQDREGLFASDYSLPKHINPNNFTIGVISMIRDQCEKITELIGPRFPDLESQYDLMIGTPEEFQGNERDIMIFSLCLDTECIRGQGFYQDEKRLNVATSRAKSFTYFVYSDYSPTFNKIRQYEQYMTGAVKDSDFPSLQKIEFKGGLPDLDYDKFESDFERYVFSYLEKYIQENTKRNKLTLHNQIVTCGQKRLDFVVFNHDTNRSVAIEVDGSYHFAKNGFSENYSAAHIERMDILTRAGWNIINTPYHKWYNQGWLSEDIDKNFKDEIDRIYKELDIVLFT